MAQHEDNLRQAAAGGRPPTQQAGVPATIPQENVPAATGPVPSQAPSGTVNPIMTQILQMITGKTAPSVPAPGVSGQDILGKVLSGLNAKQTPSTPNLAATGTTKAVYTPNGEQVKVQFGLVDANDLVTSHNEVGQINKAYPDELQPRDRTRTASKSQIQTMSNKINPDLLGDSAKVSDGAPIVGPDNVVESGNARTLALREAYQQGKGTDYKNWLVKNADSFGLDPKAVAGMKNPVLVRMRQTDVDRAEFARQANQADVASMDGP